MNLFPIQPAMHQKPGIGVVFFCSNFKLLSNFVHPDLKSAPLFVGFAV